MDCSAIKKQVDQSRGFLLDLEYQEQSWNQEKHDCPVSEHLRNLETITNISGEGKEKLIQSRRFQWDEEFKSDIDIRLIQTNFQSMKVLLHLGNFKLEVSVICTEIDEKIFYNDSSKRGSFGVVNFVQFQGVQYAAKGVAFQRGQDGIRTESAYKQYFLFSMADILGAGPKVFPLFGYDMLLTKSMVFFVMESCSGIRNKQNFQAEMLSNLQIMHSMRFIHLDIKPQNVAFSPKLNKHIFLDFGFSRIIVEPPGQKTKTKFTGTLSYCSEEMRKCCYLSMAKHVDLYENDLHCLKKTIQVLNRLMWNQNKKVDGEVQEWEEVCWENSEMSILGQVITAVRLKYFIETLNIQKILSFLESKFICKKFAYETLSSPSTPIAVSESKPVQEKLTALKKQIFSQGFCVDRVDLALCQFFEQYKRTKSAEKIIPILQILRSQSGFFEKFLTKPDFILRLFYFFQPFERVSAHNIQNLIQLKANIVIKIYKMNQTFNEPIFFSEKVRDTLVFFYKKLRGMKNLKVISTLRLLFISLQDWPYVELLQNQIIQIVDQPLMEMLKLAEFLLFKEIIDNHLKEENKNKWAKTIRDFQISSDRCMQLKLKDFLNLIVTGSKTKLKNCTLESKMSYINFLQQLSQNCLLANEKQLIYSIKYIFLQICDLPHTIYSQAAPTGLTLKIYSKYFYTVKVQANKDELKEFQFFAPIRLQYRRCLLQDYSGTMKSMAENQIEILKARGESIGQIIAKMLEIDFYQGKHVQPFINKIRETFDSEPQISVVVAVNRLISIDFCLEFIYKNLSKATQNKKITEQEKVCYVNQLEEIFNKFMQSETANKVILESKKIELHTKIIQAKFSFQKGKTSDQMRQKVQDIFALLQPLPYQSYSMIMNFITLFGYLQNQLHSNQDHYSKGILMKLAETYINEHHYLFIKKRSIITDFILIKNQAGKQEENVKTILSVVEKLRKKDQSSNKQIIYTGFLCMVLAFSFTLSADKLMKVYNLIKFNQMELRCTYHAYFVFHIFQMVSGHLSNADQLKQIKRTVPSLKNAFFTNRRLIQSEIYIKFKSLLPLKQKRKMLIFSKVQLKILNQKYHKFPLKQIRNRIDKIRQKYIEKQRNRYRNTHINLHLINISPSNNVGQVIMKLSLRIDRMEKFSEMEVFPVYPDIESLRLSYRH